MKDESNYWTKFWAKKLSRRRLLSGTAIAGGGLAVAAVVGCSSDTNTGGSSTGGGQSPVNDFLSIPSEDPFDGRRAFTPAPTDSHGGTLTYIGFDPVVLDRYDPHQTQFGPMYSNLSSVFSKLYMYKSHEQPTHDNILPDLAESAPEIIEPAPNTLTYVVKLRKGVKFHDTDAIRGNFPDLAGRELTAEDVKFSYERQASDTSAQRTYYYRSSQYKTIDKIETPDPYTLRITTKKPTAPFYHFMADTNAMIIAKEVVDNGPGPDGRPWDSIDSYQNRGVKPPDRMIGTGPFTWGTLQFGIQYEAKRNPNWFGWDDPSLGRPYMDGYKATGQGLNDSTVESLFRRKQIDTAGFIDNPQWIVNIMNEGLGLTFQRAPTSGWLNTRFKTYAKPFDDWRVRRALHLAVDRQEVVDVIGSGVWNKVGPVGKAIKLWALPNDELLAMPGYRLGADRDTDIQDARQLFEAAGKPSLPQIWFADVPDYIRRFAKTYISTIQKNLGITEEITFQTVPYQRIAEGLVKDETDLAAMTWGFDNGWVDLDDWVYPYFHTDGPKNSFRVSDPTLDKMLDDQRAEFDIEKRKQLGYTIQRYIMGEDPAHKDAPGVHCRLDYAAPGGGGIAWPYVKNRTGWPWFGNNYWTAQVWLDKSDPSYQGRA